VIRIVIGDTLALACVALGVWGFLKLWR